LHWLPPRVGVKARVRVGTCGVRLHFQVVVRSEAAEADGVARALEHRHRLAQEHDADPHHNRVLGRAQHLRTTPRILGIRIKIRVMRLRSDSSELNDVGCGDDQHAWQRCVHLMLETTTLLSNRC